MCHLKSQFDFICAFVWHKVSVYTLLTFGCSFFFSLCRLSEQAYTRSLHSDPSKLNAPKMNTYDFYFGIYVMNCILYLILHHLERRSKRRTSKIDSENKFGWLVAVAAGKLC